MDVGDYELLHQRGGTPFRVTEDEHAVARRLRRGRGFARANWYGGRYPEEATAPVKRKMSELSLGQLNEKIEIGRRAKVQRHSTSITRRMICPVGPK